MEHEHTRSKLFNLSVCKIKFNSVHLIPRRCLRGHEMTMRLNWGDSVGIHLPGKHDDCVSCSEAAPLCITNAVGDDERASKGVGLITLILDNQTVPFSRDVYIWHWG